MSAGDMNIFTKEPLNCSPAPHRLADHYITPLDLFFVRSHGAVPEIDTDTFRLMVDGLVTHPLELSLDDLKSFTPREVTATLSCAGNRRTEFHAHKPIEKEIIWDGGAVGNGTWRGASLRDVLLAAGLPDGGGDLHVAFEGLDWHEVDGEQIIFGGSIPLAQALVPDVLLAYEMNGAPLTPDRGWPLRGLVPGYVGARSIKWLKRITVQDKPSDNYYQARAYKTFPPGVDAKSADWSQGVMVGEQPVNSIITEPLGGAELDAGKVTLRGLAIPSGANHIVHVDVSVDGGQQWEHARLTTAAAPYAWAFWEAELTLEPGAYELAVRATDSGGHVQPADPAAIWNFKGYLNNSYHRIPVRVRG